MKKFVFCAALALSVLMVFACKSKPATIEEELKSTYEKYSGALILEGAEPYTVKSGDTLTKIAKAKYGNGLYFPIIVLASVEVVEDFDKIDPGMVLTLPDLQRNLDDANAKSKIKSFLGDISGIEDERSRPKDAAGMRDLANSL